MFKFIVFSDCKLLILCLVVSRTVLYVYIFEREAFLINNDEYCWQIGGIGKVTEHILKGVFGINTCEQMLEKASYLCALFSQSTAG